MKKTSGKKLAKLLGISSARGMQAVMKAELISAVLDQMSKKNITHIQLAEKAGLPRSAVTGILSGSLQKVTVDRILRLVEAVGLVAEVKIHKMAA